MVVGPRLGTDSCYEVGSDWGWPGGGPPSDQTSSMDRGLGINAVSELVDGDVMVEPTKGYQV